MTVYDELATPEQPDNYNDYNSHGLVPRIVKSVPVLAITPTYVGQHLIMTISSRYKYLPVLP